MHKTTNSRFISINQYMNGVDPSQSSPENSEDSPHSPVSNDGKIASTSSSKTSRRGAEKKVVSVPIKDVEGLRLKGDHMSAPPSDSWAWRKYGQKPIKGSPYPRAYYRCSSSKGCSARKQVERSKVDPNMLIVTYACEHNHPWPASRSNHCQTIKTTASGSVSTSLSEEDEATEQEEEEEEEEEKLVNIPTIEPQSPISEYKFSNLPLINASEFGWFTDIESMLESPILTEDRIDTEELGDIFKMREEDELLFADLGELPECSTVFRHGMAGREVEQRRHSLASTS